MVNSNRDEVILYYYLADAYKQTNLFYNSYNMYMHFQSHKSCNYEILNFCNSRFAAL